MPAKRPTPWTLLSVLLPMLVSACAQPSPPSAVVPRAPFLLPQEARQPTPPKECLPTCSEGLTRLRTELLDSLTPATSPGSPASAPPTR